MPIAEAIPDWVTPCRESLPLAHRNILDLLDYVPWEILAVLVVLGLLSIITGIGTLLYCGCWKTREAWAKYNKKPRKKPAEPRPIPVTALPKIEPLPEPKLPVLPSAPELPLDARLSPRNDSYPAPSGVLAIINNAPPAITPIPEIRQRRGRSTTPRCRDQTPKLREPTPRKAKK